MLHFHTSLNIYQNFHHSNQNYTKKCKLFLHCREQCIHQCMCVCVWLKNFHFPVQSPLAARPEPLHSALHPPRFSLLLDLAGCLDSPWPNDHPSCTVCIWCIFSSRDHRCRKSNNPVFQSFFQSCSNIFHLVFFLFPLPSADGAAQRIPPASRQLALGTAVNLCQSLL